MSFYYQKYGTFTGIGTYQYTYRDNDDFTNNFYDDGVFNLNDISMVLLNTPQDFVTLHLDGHNTDQLTLEKVQGSFISTVASPGFDYDTYGHYYTYGTSLPIETIKFNVNNFNVGYAGGGDGNTNVKGDFKVNTNKFTVSASTGDTYIDRDLLVNRNVTANEVTAGGITLTSRKSFDISHPVKSGYRLRHVCLEGPESAVYYRGRLSNSNIINLPDYWVGLVDPESITVTLTQINYSQDLIVEKIDSGKNIKIRSGNSSTIDCYFLVHGERIDGEKLIVEYEGNQYPGDDSQYSLNK